MRQKLALKFGKLGDILRRLGPWHVGVTAHRAGGRAGRIQKHGIEQFVRLEIHQIGGDGLRLETETFQIAVEPLEPVFGKVERGHIRALKHKLRRLATGGGAEVCNPFAFDVAHQAGRQACRHILHPPVTFGKAGQVGEIAFDRLQAHRTVGQRHATQLFGPCLRIALHREIDRRLIGVHRENGRGLFSAIGVGDAFSKPLRHVGFRFKRVGECAFLVARQPAQQRIDETGIFAVARVVVRRFHCQIDRRMVGQVEIENLRDGDMQKMLQRHRIFRQGPVEPLVDGALDAAAIAQRRTQNGANQRTVARLQRQILRMTVGIVGQAVERSVLFDHRAEKACCTQTCRQTGAQICGVVGLRLLISTLRRGFFIVHTALLYL